VTSPLEGIRVFLRSSQLLRGEGEGGKDVRKATGLPGGMPEKSFLWFGLVLTKRDKERYHLIF